MILLYIGVGAAVGAVARYGLGVWVHGNGGVAFPWGTLLVNTAGSFFIGFAVRYFEAIPVTLEARALVTVGLLGGFTTFSAFTFETLSLLRGGDWLEAGLYSFGSVGLGVVAVAMGVVVAGAVFDPGG